MTKTFNMLESNELYTIYPIPEAFKFSKSKIDLFYTCQWQYFFRYLTDYPVKPTVWPATLLGETIHEILEFVIEQLRNKIKPTKINKEIKGKFTEIFDRKLVEQKEFFKKSKAYKYDKMIKNGERFALLINNFIIKYFNSFYDIKSEVEFDYKVFPNVRFTGFADIVFFKSPEEYSVFDLKNTKDSNKFYVVDWNRDLQSNIYLYLSKKMFNDIYAQSFGYLVFNYELEQIFIKSNKLSDGLLYDDHYLSLFKYFINPMIEFIVDPKNKKFQNSKASPIQCYWCNYKTKCKFNKGVIN